jgi:hypothetical protein
MTYHFNLENGACKTANEACKTAYRSPHDIACMFCSQLLLAISARFFFFSPANFAVRFCLQILLAAFACTFGGDSEAHYYVCTCSHVPYQAKLVPKMPLEVVKCMANRKGNL